MQIADALANLRKIESAIASEPNRYAEWRDGGKTKAGYTIRVPFLSWRTVCDLLDQATEGNWCNQVRMQDGIVICHLSVAGDRGRESSADPKEERADGAPQHLRAERRAFVRAAGLYGVRLPEGIRENAGGFPAPAPAPPEPPALAPESGKFDRHTDHRGIPRNVSDAIQAAAKPEHFKNLQTLAERDGWSEQKWGPAARAAIGERANQQGVVYIDGVWREKPAPRQNARR